MEDLVVAAVQMNAPLGEVQRNREEVVRWARQAAHEGAELVCFPELIITGHWVAPEAWDVCEPVPDGETTRLLVRLAGELGVTISFGIGELEHGLAYNTQVIVGPEGYLGKQRKLHMSRDEYFHYRTGTRMPVIDIGKCKVGIGICYDNMLPEVARIAAVRGAEVYLMPHASRFGEWTSDADRRQQIVRSHKQAHRKYYTSRAYDNGMFVVDCNQAGPAGPNTNHAGGILIFGPDGEVIAESVTDWIEDDMVICELSAEAYAARRRAACFNLQTRRPEIYGALAEGAPGLAAPAD